MSNRQWKTAAQQHRAGFVTYGIKKEYELVY